MMTRREREDQDRAAHILEVAERLFAEKGLQNTSVADIAKAAEFGVGTIYKYFKDKNTLIEELLTDRTNEQFDALGETLLGDDPPEVLLDRFVEAYLHAISTRMDFYRIYFTNFNPGSDNGVGSSLSLTVLDDRKMLIFKRLDEIFEKGIDTGQIADVGSSSYLTSAVWGILMSFYFLAEFRFEGRVNVEEMKDVFARIFFERVNLSKRNQEEA